MENNDFYNDPEKENKVDDFSSDVEQDEADIENIEEKKDTSLAFGGFYNDNFAEYREEEPEIKPEARYDDIFDSTKPKSMGFSITSMVLGIISVLCCCCMGWISLILGAGAIIFAIISRRSLGYFDGFSIAGLILGIFGVCFGVMMIVALLGPVQDFIKNLEAAGDAEFDVGSNDF